MLRLRTVEEDDCRLLWEWVNDPGVREIAFEPGAIPWEQHVAWFRRKRADPRCRMYLAVDERNAPVAQVRFDLEPDGQAVVTISVAREHRGRGLGWEALQLACRCLFTDTDAMQVVAYVRPHNAVSLRMFEHAGFTRAGTERVKGQEAVRMTLERPLEGDRDMKTYIVAARHSWNRRLFEDRISRYPGRWFFIDAPEAIDPQWVKTLDPRYFFFLHWSWRVPAELVHAYECVCFHMTDLPYGRGGTPLQNLIVRGHRETTLTALRMVEEFDAGPIYLKEPLSLEGLAEEIYIRASRLAAEMILKIIQEETTPLPQTGTVEVFRRRTPAESEIPECADLQTLFDFLRMLDAGGFPRAFLTYNGFRFEFSRPALYDGRIVADVKITAAEDESG